MSKMISIQKRHSEKWLARVVNLKSFSLESHFSGVAVDDARAAEVLRREIAIMGKPMQVNAEKTKGRLRVHSNQWYEFDIRPDSAVSYDILPHISALTAAPAAEKSCAKFADAFGVEKPAEAPAETLTDASLDELMVAWDEMDNATQRMLTALPSQMTEAAARLEAMQRAMRTALQKVALAGLRK